MLIKQIIETVNAELLVGDRDADTEIKSGCGSDLMSDVLAFSKEKVLLLTGLVNPQVVRTAEMMDIKAILFVRGKKPTTEMLELAEEMGIMILTTEDPMYIACGKLYSSGLGCGG